MILCYKYYLEIKNRLLLTFLTWISVLLTCYYFKEPLLFMFINLNKYYNKLGNTPYFVFLDVAEIFYTYLKLIFFLTNQIFALTIIYQILMFSTLGLRRFEYIQLRFLFQILIVTWLLSIFLFQKCIMPLSWAFFLSFQITNDNLQPASFFFEAKIIEYLKYFINLYYICLLNCQILVLLTLVLNTISKESKIIRKLFYFMFILFSTVTTPPDISSQIIMSFILIFIHEVLIFYNILTKLARQPIKTNKNSNCKH